MEYQEKIQWLKQYQYSLRKERELALEVEQLRTEAEHITPLLSGMPGGGPNADKLPVAVERIIKAQEDLTFQINVCQALRGRIVELIDTVHDERQHEVLRRRYILGQRWENIAVEMNIGIRHVYRAHRNAIMSLYVTENERKL